MSPFAASLALVRLADRRTRIEDAALLVLVARREGEDVTWLESLPPAAAFHVLQKGESAHQPEVRQNGSNVVRRART